MRHARASVVGVGRRSHSVTRDSQILCLIDGDDGRLWNDFIFSPDRAGLIALSWNVDTKLKPISGFLRHGHKLHLPDQIYFSPLASMNEAPSGEHLNGAQIEFRCNNVAIEMART